MTKIGEYNMWKGRKVKIYSPDYKKFLGVGKYERQVKIMLTAGKKDTGITAHTPKFKLGRKTILGCDCWWIPVSVADKVEGVV